MRLTILWQGVHHRGAILTIFQGSPQRIRLTTFTLRDVELDGVNFSQRIIRMLNRGVQVTIVIGEDPFEMAKKAQKEPVYWEYLKSLKKITDYRANAYYHRRIHAKVLLAETEHSASAIVTSANFTARGLSIVRKGNREVGCYLHNLDKRTERALTEATADMIELARRNPLGRDLEQILGSGRDVNVV